MRIKCCFGCEPPKRHIGCHSTCAQYKAEKAVLDARREEVLKIRDANTDYKVYLERARLKNSKRRRRNK